MKIQEETTSEYCLIQTLQDCKRTTRCLFASNDLLISGNFDNKVNVYQLYLNPPNGEASDSGVLLPQFQLMKSFDIFDSFVYSVTYLPEKSLLAVGCKSGNIYLLGLESDFMQILSTAHAKAVCSLSFHIDDDESILPLFF
jgi:WD40 repeat protein